MKAPVLFVALILIGLLAKPSEAQELNSANVQVLQRSLLKIKSFNSDGEVIREGAGFFLNAEGEVVTNRQVVRDADRVEVRTADDTLYSADLVTGVDDSTGVIRLTLSNLQTKVPLPSSTNLLKLDETVFILTEQGAIKLTPTINFRKIELATVGLFYKVLTPIGFAKSGNPVVDSSGQLAGILLSETIGGGKQNLIIPKQRISNLTVPIPYNASFNEWNKRNNLEWMLSGPGLYYKGIVLQVTEGCDQALSVFESALEEDRDHANAWFFAGRCKAERGNAQDAIEYYRHALRLKPDFAEAHVGLGDAYIDAFGVFGAETYITALDSYRKAIGLRIGYDDAFRSLDRALKGVAQPATTSSSSLSETFQMIKGISGLKSYGIVPGGTFHGVSQPLDRFYLKSNNGPLTQYEGVVSIENSGVWQGFTGVERGGGRDYPLILYNDIGSLTNLDFGDPYPTKSYPVANRDPFLFHSDSYAPESPYLLGTRYQVLPQPEYIVRSNFNPFLARTSSGVTYLRPGPEYPIIGSNQTPLELKPKSPFAHLQPDLSFFNTNQNVSSSIPFLNALETRPKLNLGTNQAVVASFRLGVKFEFGQGVNFGQASENWIRESMSNRITASYVRPEAPETLFSASWFTDAQASKTASDLDQAQVDLQAGTRYLLKVAVQDTPFAQVVQGIITGQTKALPSQLIPGTEMELLYYSVGLEPREGSVRFELPQKGETKIAAFPVSTTTSNIKGLPVHIEIRLKGLIIYTGTMVIKVVPQIEGVVAERPPASKGAGVPLIARSNLNEMAVKNYKDLGTNDVEITITQHGTGPFYLTLHWKGGERITKASGLTPGGLNQLMEGVRSDLKAMIDDLGDIPTDDSKGLELDALVMNPNIRQQIIFRLAKVGHRLHRNLFKDPEHRAILKQVKAHAQANPEAVLRVQVVNRHVGEQSIRMLLPFGLLYDDPNFSENSDDVYEAKVENFWDSRYQIEFDETAHPYKKWTLCENERIEVAAVMDTGGPPPGSSTAKDWRKEIEEQKKFLEGLAEKKRISVKFIKDENEFLKIFKGDPSPLDLIYYYGHTSTGSKPSFRITNDSRTISQVRDAAMDQDQRLRQLKKFPFVFLNSCKGVAFSGEAQDTFLNLMNDVGASGFIGTETVVRIPYAARIGQEFFKKIVSYQTSVPLVQVMREMKHEALSSKDGNPLIMLYSYYGAPSLHTCAYK